MPEFHYRAIKRDGSPISGKVSAESKDGVLRQLRQQGLTPIDISSGGTAIALVTQPAARHRLRRRSDKVRTADLLAVTSELAVLLRAGLPLDRALKVLIGFIDHPRLGGVLADLLEKVKSGKAFSQALQNHHDIFGDFYINMIRSAEAGGQLPEVLGRLTEHLERVKALQQSVISALIYPVILILVAILSVGMMLVFVVPQFESLFEDMGDALPVPTQMILAVAHLVQGWGWLLLPLGLLAWLGFRSWLGSESGQSWRDRTLLKLPIFGGIVGKYEITRFARSMGTLLNNGVSLLEALNIATQTIGNGIIRNALAPLPAHIKQGGRIGQALEQTHIIPPLGLHMIQIGEETGRLDSMFLELARVYDEEVQSGVKRALTLLEPILILSLGAIIALIIISILMGILSVNELAA